jgi:hypothetical protein
LGQELESLGVASGRFEIRVWMELPR